MIHDPVIELFKIKFRNVQLFYLKNISFDAFGISTIGEHPQQMNHILCSIHVFSYVIWLVTKFL